MVFVDLAELEYPGSNEQSLMVIIVIDFCNSLMADLDERCGESVNSGRKHQQQNQ
jgi:hypothetical protein